MRGVHPVSKELQQVSRTVDDKNNHVVVPKNLKHGGYVKEPWIPEEGTISARGQNSKSVPSNSSDWKMPSIVST